MHDIHSHILPGVDDGAFDVENSLEMLEAAQKAGVTAITCTPHVRGTFNYAKCVAAYEELRAAAPSFPLRLGFEVNHTALMNMGIKEARYLHFDRSHDFLLELSSNASASSFSTYERTIFELQGMGYNVIIAHPERYKAIQEDVSIAERLVRAGCKLQASADFMSGGRLGREKRPARKMLQAGLYSYIASDAHAPEHYEELGKAMAKFSDLLIG